MNQYLLRAAVAEDVHAVLAFWETAGENSGRPADSAAAVAALIARDPGALILAYGDRGELAGSVIAGWDGWRAALYRLAVAPAHRRRGLSQQLIAAAEQRVAQAGATRASAMVLDSNSEAHLAWRRAGYGPQAAWSRWVKPIP